MIDAGIYQLAGRGVKSVADYDAEASKARQNKLAEMLSGAKMNEYQRGITDQNALRQTLQGFGADQGANQLSLIRGGHLKEAQDYAKSNADTGKVQGDIAKQKVDLVDSKLKQSRAYLDTVTTPEQYIAWHEANHKDPILGAELAARGVTAGQARASIMQALQTPGGFEELMKKSALGIEKFTEQNKPTYQTRNTGGTTDTLQLPGMGGAPSVVSSIRNTQSPESIASNATQRRGQDLSDKRAGDLNQITRELGLTEKELKIGKMQDEATARGQQKQAAVSSVKNQIAVIDKALNHKGRETATGLSGSADPRNFIPGTDATDFKVVVDQIGGAAFLQAFESLKGGGQITEVEGKKATDAMARLNRSQSDKEFKVALTDLRKVMSDGLSRLSVGSPANQPAAVPQPSANPIDSLLDKYK